jgi:hypothetical protein
MPEQEPLTVKAIVRFARLRVAGRREPSVSCGPDCDIDSVSPVPGGAF